MIIEFPDINPVAISLWGIDLYWYGFSYVAGLFCTWRMMIYWGAQHGITQKAVDNMMHIAIICMVIGGRLGHVILYDFALITNDFWHIFNTRAGGMSFHGGFIGVICGLLIYVYKNKLNPWSIGDICALSTPITIFSVRIANLINQEHLGRPTFADWGMSFAVDNHEILRYPSQLYEAFTEGLLVLMILLLIKRLKTPKGFIMGSFIFLTGTTRFIIEYYRTADGMVGFLSKGQLYSIPLIICGIIIMIIRIKPVRANGTTANDHAKS